MPPAEKPASPEPAAPRGHLSITVVDVAREAGVSAMTVSRVLNRPEGMPPATVAKVREAVEKTGYIPNRTAGALRSRQSRLVAAIVPTLSGPVFLETIEALTTGLAARGYHLMVGQSGYVPSREDPLLVDIISRRPDGIVLTGVVHSEAARRRLVASRIPVVETWDFTEQPIETVIGFSHEAVGRAVGRHFAETGRRRWAWIGADDVRAQRRWQAFRDVAAENGLAEPAAEIVAAPARFADGRRGLDRLLRERPGVDAVFCSSDLVAQGVLTEALARRVPVPGAVAVVGFGDLAFARDLEPALSTVRVDGSRIGTLAADCIVGRAEGRGWEERAVDVGFELVRRGSS